MVKPIPYVVAITIAVLSVSVAGQSSDINNIPPHLLECYQNASLYNRENRLPMTMSILIELIQTIEYYPGFNMDMRSLALSLTHMFRVDGIEKDPSVQATTHTTPYRLTGYQFNKHRILMESLIPRSTYQFPNASLSSIQKCSLHFMLSNSIDIMERGDESSVCNVITGVSSQRLKRQVESEESSNKTNSEPQASPEISSVAVDDKPPAALEPEVQLGEQEQVKAIGNSSDSDVEFVQVKLPKEFDTEQKEDMQLNTDGDSSFNPLSKQQRPTYPESSCPVENGVVYTKWGSVSAGTVLAGIATGLEQQNVRITDIRSNFNGSTSLSIANQWAATLAGDLAEVALRQGPKGTNSITVGAPGGWNSTRVPRWYFIGSDAEMTDAEIRGGIDGLIMATYVREWNQKTNGNLRLSTLLDRYYSNRGVFDPQYRACMRNDLYTKVAPLQTMQEQTFNFASTMSGSSPDIVVIQPEGITEYTQAAIKKLNDYVSSDISRSCSTASQSRASINTTLDEQVSHVDLYIVVDCAWPYKDVQDILWELPQDIATSHPIGSNLTVLSGKTFTTLSNASRILNFAAYGNCEKGMDIKNLLDVHLRALFYKQLEMEKQQQSTDDKSKVVLFIPYTGFSPSGTDLETAMAAVRDYRTKLPDIKFLYMTSGNVDNIRSLVEESLRDIITYSDAKPDIQPVITRIKEVPRRITNPFCNVNLTEATYSTVQFQQYVAFSGANYYRVHPKYLFGISDGSIKIKGEGYGTLKVCHSRKDKYSDNSTTSQDDSKCSQIMSNETIISLSSACSGYEYFLQCQPLYITVQSIDATPTINCNTEECRNNDDLKFTVTHQGLTCGVGRFLANPSTLTLTAVLLTVFKMLFSS